MLAILCEQTFVSKSCCFSQPKAGRLRASLGYLGYLFCLSFLPCIALSRVVVLLGDVDNRRKRSVSPVLQLLVAVVFSDGDEVSYWYFSN